VHYSGGGRPGGALVLALPLLALGVAAVLVLQAALRETVTRPLWGARTAGSALTLPAWWRALGGAALVAVAAQVLVPVVVLVADSCRYGDAASAVASAVPDMLTTLGVAALAAILCLPMATAAARGLASRGARGAAWWFLAAAPLAVPAPLVGIGLVTLWNRPLVDGVYETAAMPVLASLARFTTLAAIVVAAQERRIDPLLFDAGRVFQRGRLRAWVQVRLPMLAPGLLAAALGVAALSAGELGATLIVAPPGTSTLSMRIYSYLHYGALENAAGLCLVMTAASAAAVAGGFAGFRVWSRLMPGPGRTGR